jgi:hypothetical protein
MLYGKWKIRDIFGLPKGMKTEEMRAYWTTKMLVDLYAYERKISSGEAAQIILDEGNSMEYNDPTEFYLLIENEEFWKYQKETLEEIIKKSSPVKLSPEDNI